MVTIKGPEELRRMREAGRVVARALAAAQEAARPGTTPRELDEVAAGLIADAGARPSFTGYRPSPAYAPYPAVLCVSVNDTVVHGIPGTVPLEEGDVVSVDCGAIVDGFHGDAARTFTVGAGDPGAQRLIAATEKAYEAALEHMVPGARLSDLSHAIESTARAEGFGIVEDQGGHGIGTEMHEDPHLANTGRPGRGPRLREGLVLAIEPLLTEGGSDGSRLLADGWSIATADGSRAAHHENTVAVTAEGPWVLTAL
ncbi:type I methionyl aminopeptidase [Nocardiopsis chromatogenes]|uniref:type I methionyl aminopeptidase n=1 Tax=Nocardiopsis chromatogenes TaxID=280239 RepID=UPI00034B0703|nr:type I methionyl aminopeptidase [Nocardiopsis chromatogenes]